VRRSVWAAEAAKKEKRLEFLEKLEKSWGE